MSLGKKGKNWDGSAGVEAVWVRIVFQFQLFELPKVVLWVFRLDLVVKWS